jgi:type I restriction-modification system DNA methylase subunit
MTKWINIFKTGTHTDSAGRTRTWTEADLDKIVSNYEQRTEDPPLVFGHPKSNDPAEGWIVAVRRFGEFLQAQFARLTDKAREGVKNKAYKYVSLSLTPELNIRHLGLLGAVPPGVKGLGEVEFQDGEDMTVIFNFNEPGDPAPEDTDMTKELEAKLAESERKQAEAEKKLAEEKAAREKAESDLKTKEEAAAKREAEQRAADHSAKVDKLIEDGKLLPADKEKVLAFCAALDGGEEMSFSADEGKKPVVDHFLSFMAEGRSNALMTEFSAPGKDGGSAVTEDMTQYV